MSTVEAIQVELAGRGVILFPGSPERPPERIYAEDVERGDYRVFPSAHADGPVFRYAWEGSTDSWVHISTVPAMSR